MNVVTQMRVIFREMYRKRHFNAIFVEQVGTNSMRVRRTGYDEVEGPYPAASGLAASLSPGDRVKVEFVNGNYQVAYQVEE